MSTPLAPLDARLGPYAADVDAALATLKADDVIRRIWQHDHTVWRPDPDEITNRLGWLHAPRNMQDEVECIRTLVKEVQDDGYTDVLLMGMGGSSLAPEVFMNVFGPNKGYLNLAVVDSTDPDMIRARAEGLNLAKTLFIVATKSGGTAETLSAYKHFYNRTLEAVGAGTVGRHFVAITDPGSRLVDIAERRQFRALFLNDPNIGGRYAALSLFGLVPAALVGVDIEKLLARAQAAATDASKSEVPVSGEGQGGRLGAIMGVLEETGHNKITLVASPAIASFGDWVEQLIAESTGKDGKGILPVVGEALGPPDVYGRDRLFVYLRLKGDTTHEAALDALADAGHPVVVVDLEDTYDLGSQFFIWEMATVVAGHLMDIQPFDQPNVESAKVRAREMVTAYKKEGSLPEGETLPVKATILHGFLDDAAPGDYIALHAYVPPTEETDAALNALRLMLRDRYHLATTVGYGPRFLHSTGQLHKGDAGNGWFIQFVSDPVEDLPIPDDAGAQASAMSFGVLKQAQALGDAQALEDADRSVLRMNLGTNVVAGLNALMHPPH